MSRAIIVRFTEALEPYSDKEGLIPSRVERAGYDRKKTLVAGDRETLYVTIGDEEPDEDRFERLLDLLFEGWEPSASFVMDAPGGFLLEWGEVGDAVDGIESVEVGDIPGEADLYQSASVAKSNEE